MIDQRVADLAAILKVDQTLLTKHLLLPLRPGVKQVVQEWPCHTTHAKILSICDGFTLFSEEYEDGFVFYGSRDLLPTSSEYVGEYIASRSREFGIVPIFGTVPQSVSARVADGAVVESDWENTEDDRWLRVIATSIPEYVATLISVREAYGHHEDGWPLGIGRILSKDYC
jgi:hypothetical protein